MRVTAVCPCCQKRLSTRLTYRRKRRDLRRCDGCGALLFRVNTDVQPWSLMLLTVLFGLLIFTPVCVLWFSADFGWWSLPLAFMGVPLALLFDYLQFPYTNGYVQWYKTCRDCGYDMRGSANSCPECGGLAARHPEAVVRQKG